MPHPHINTNSSNNKCCKYASKKTGGGGVGRVMFLGNTNSNINNIYVSGSGVGASSIAVRKALMRRATSNNHCCNK